MQPISDTILSAILNLFPGIPLPQVMNFKMIFLSIIIESLPFILIGVMVSALLNNFISEEHIRRFLPQKSIYSIFPACLLGIVFPVCECGIVPIARRLISKGVPLPAAVAFMLAAPIINPVVAAATAVAFNDSLMIMGLRLGMALLITLAVCLILNRLFQGNELKNRLDLQLFGDGCNCGCQNPETPAPTLTDRITTTLQDACHEFFEMGRYLILGAFLSSIAQTLIPREFIMSIGQDPFASVIVMMLFGFGVSVCSTADAFISASFGSSFTLGSLLAFMVFGPMIDLKNTLMMLHAFRTRFVVTLAALTAILTACVAYLLNIIIKGGIV